MRSISKGRAPPANWNWIHGLAPVTVAPNPLPSPTRASRWALGKAAGWLLVVTTSEGGRVVSLMPSVTSCAVRL
jgi:hypothetical protein